ncbi:lipopolysaccharide biosynthesis protein [Sphingobacterium litopenaei]|uniref:Lipopolysaccharide biosynthesis protein n=1 Tax=Sphingobacterium litopenaei TaxID=2763500 RepID=A0ABR7YEN1_9SPHI|nr:lipopolysaccharide biosynthesis protein [Sphingobacterium litopenaei]MBD1429768.1 lipopolysaccharide biosynthesis protein [Sphingobacterium litopenaei]
MSLKVKAVSGLFWTIFQQFGYQGINFLVQLFLARILMPEAFGVIALLQIFISIANNLIDSGMTSSLIRNKDISEVDYSTVFFLNITVSFVLYIIAFISAPYISAFYAMPILDSVIKVYCISFVINAFSIIQITKLTKEMKFRTQVLVQIPSLIISGVVSIYLAKTGWGVWSIVIYNLLQNILLSIQYWVRSKWIPKFLFNKERLKYHFNFGYKLTIASLLNSIYDNIYGVIIGKTFSPQVLGYYNRAELFQLFPSKNLSTALEKVTYPMFSQIQDDNVRLKRYYRQIFNLVVFFLTPTMILFSVLATPLFTLLLTDKWLPMVPFFQIMTVVGVLHPFQRYNLNILRVKGRSDLVLKLNIIKKIILTVLIIVSVQYGIYGILISQCLFSIISVGLNSMYSSRMINYSLKEQILDIIGIYLLSIGVGFLVYVLDNNAFISLNNFSRVLLGLFIGYIMYFLMAFLLKFEVVAIIRKFIKERKFKNE